MTAVATLTWRESSRRCQQRHHAECQDPECACKCHAQAEPSAASLEEMPEVDMTGARRGRFARVIEAAPEHGVALATIPPTPSGLQGSEAGDGEGNLPEPDYSHLTLEALAEIARERHTSVQWYARKAITESIHLGAVLKAARDKVKAEGGFWLQWLKDEANLSEDLAERYLVAWKNREILKLMPPETSLTAAIRYSREQRAIERGVRVEESLRGIAQQITLPTELVMEAYPIEDLPIPEGSADLIVTSPPYGLGMEYETGEGEEDWVAYSARVDAWAERLAAYAKGDTGRLALNVPLDVGYHETPEAMYAEWLNLLRAYGWVYQTTIIWADDQMGKRSALGSLGSQSAPCVYAPVEMVLVMHRGQWHRPTPEHLNKTDLEVSEQVEWGNGLWRMNGASLPWHPAPFPVELPRRLVKLYSFPGDVVLDPFIGSGSTAIAAYPLGRTVWGFDKSERYIELARARVAWECGLEVGGGR